MRSQFGRAFTLVEILIVVVILGILSAMVVPQFTRATSEAEMNATYDQLTKARRAIAVFFVRNGNEFPQIQPGSGPAAWGQLITTEGYLRKPPVNMWVGKPNDTVVIAGPALGPDTGYQTTHAWIFNTTTGDLWAGGFDAQDQPFPRP